MTKEALIIFVKNPELGKVKTRLAATVGDKKALEVYKKLLEHTCQVTKNISQDKWVFYSERIDNNDLWDDSHYHKTVQSDGDLGQKMLNAFNHCFEQGYESVCIIGSDMMEINESTIKKAFISLKADDVVIGPAKDGGYYLLGMNKLHSSLFQNKQWSTESVLSDTLLNIEQLKLSCTKLETMNDIDTENDWNSYLVSL